jgi:hypothetical protein
MGVVMKKTARNDVTGDWMQSKPKSEQFEKNFDLIFRKKKEVLPEYELNKSTGNVQKVDHGDTTNTQE